MKVGSTNGREGWRDKIRPFRLLCFNPIGPKDPQTTTSNPHKEKIKERSIPHRHGTKPTAKMKMVRCCSASVLLLIYYVTVLFGYQDTFAQSIQGQSRVQRKRSCPTTQLQEPVCMSFSAPSLRREKLTRSVKKTHKAHA